jgi:hypothetical protein
MRTHRKVTPELRRWIVKQIEAGVQPQPLLESMIQQGWPEGAALDIFERTLRARAAQLQALKRQSTV